MTKLRRIALVIFIIIAAIVLVVAGMLIVIAAAPNSVRDNIVYGIATSSSGDEASYASSDNGVITDTLKARGSAVESAPESAVQDSDTSNLTDTTSADQKIIKTADLTFTVDDVAETANKIASAATAAGGFVSTSDTWQSSSTQLSGQVTVRVPVNKFEEVLTQTKELALVVTSESISGQDVTEAYTDLAARLRNAKAQEEELLKILDRATTVEDILKVQKQLTTAREEVEVLQGRMNYLENQTSLSTISYTLHEETSVEVPRGVFRPLSTVKDAFAALLAIGQGTVTIIIWAIVVLGGLLLPIAIVVWILYRLIKAIYHRRKGGRQQNMK